jgi:hypothetical protein
MPEEKISECLFYRTFRSYLLQNSDFKLNFEILLDQYKSQPKSFSVFSKKDVQRLIQMQHAYKTGNFNIFQTNFNDVSFSSIPKGEDLKQKHSEIVQHLYKNKETMIIPYTGPIEDACPEYPVIFGNIDLLVISEKCAYSIEVKTDPATHSIVGQQMKYFIGLCLKFNLKHFNDVKLITVCPGYDNAAYVGLKQLGALMLVIDSNTLNVSKLY